MRLGRAVGKAEGGRARREGVEAGGGAVARAGNSGGGMDRAAPRSLERHGKGDNRRGE